MPVRDLQRLLIERHLTKREKIVALKNCRLGIDGFHFLKSITGANNEPFQCAMGGIPLTMKKILRKELIKFKDAGITPVFVFNGFSIRIWERPGYGNADKTKKRRNAWISYEQGKPEEAAHIFLSTSNSSVSIEFLRSIIKYFKQNNVEFFMAPYLSFAQLAWFLNRDKPLIHAVYGGHECLLFDVNKLITKIDFQNGIFEYIDRDNLLDKLQITQDQFIDTCILSGCYFSNTFHPIVEASPSYTFQYALDMVKYHGSGYAYIQLFGDEEYIDKFLKCKTTVYHHIVFDVDSNMKIFDQQNCPYDLHEVMGMRLPNEIYFLLSQGIISQKVISSLLTNAYYEQVPLVDSEELRNDVNFLMHIRSSAVNLLSANLHNYFHESPINIIRWFDYKQRIPVPRRKFKPLTEAVQWKINHDDIQRELRRQYKTTTASINFQFVARWKPPISKRNEIPKTLDEADCYILLKTLEILGYMEKVSKNSTSYELNNFGRALVIGKAFPQQTVCLLEMIRARVLTSKKFTPITKIGVQQLPPLPQKQLKPNEEEITLITRVLSLIPMELKEQPWNADVDQDLAAFNSLITVFYKGIRNLIEMILTSMFLTRKLINIHPQELLNFSFRLPFYEEPNTAMGIVAKRILETPSDKLSKLLEDIKTVFPCCEDPLGDLTKGVAFWDQMVVIVGALASLDPSYKGVFAEFEKANKFLQKKRTLIQMLSPQPI